MQIEEKLAAISKLMDEGVLTANEFAGIVQLLTNDAGPNSQPSKTPEQVSYERFIREQVLPGYKSPGTAKFPDLAPSMIVTGDVLLQEGFKSSRVRLTYIETYVDATNSYGAFLRKNLRIVVNEALEPQYAIARVPLTADTWHKVRPTANARTADTTAATWSHDPTGRHELRYWDGTAWTGHVSDGGQQSEDQMA